MHEIALSAAPGSHAVQPSWLHEAAQRPAAERSPGPLPSAAAAGLVLASVAARDAVVCSAGALVVVEIPPPAPKLHAFCVHALGEAYNLDGGFSRPPAFYCAGDLPKPVGPALQHRSVH